MKQTSFKPTLKQYGKLNKYRISLKKLLTIIIALPLGTAWMVVLLPFMKGSLELRI